MRRRENEAVEDTVLQRYAVARWLLAIPFAGLGLLGVAASLASGLLTLPCGVLFIAVAVWLVSGADDQPGPVLQWTLVVSGGITALMLLGGVVLGTVR